MAFKLARYRNALAGSELIPATVIDKPPSAELRPEQKDTDTQAQTNVEIFVMKSFKIEA